MLHDGRKTFVNVNNNEERYQTHAEHPLYNTFFRHRHFKCDKEYFYFIFFSILKVHNFCIV